MQKFYLEDLAYVHHHGFGEFAEQAGNGILTLLGNHGISGGHVVDLGCGSGIWAGKLLKAGFEVTGVDVSAAMLALAEINAPGAVFYQASVFDFSVPRCQVVTALGEVLGYGVDSNSPPDDDRLAQLFRHVAQQLEPDGVFLFDIIDNSGVPSLNGQGWRTGRDWAVLFATEENPKQQNLTRTMTIFREVNGHYRRSEECHQVRTFDGSAIESQLGEAGFEVTSARAYGTYGLAPRRLAFIAEKT